jgi:hypothetical protein
MYVSLFTVTPDGLRLRTQPDEISRVSLRVRGRTQSLRLHARRRRA